MEWTVRVLVTATRCLGAGVVLLVLSTFTPLVNHVARLGQGEPRLQSAEAIVVLGGGIHPDGSLTASSLRRVTAGIRLYQRRLAPLIVFSGPASGAAVSEASVAADIARDFGVPSDHILVDSGGRTTREEVRRISGLLGQRGIRRVLLVTDWEHLRRASPLFTDAGVATLPVPADPLPSAADSPEARLQLLRKVTAETFGRLYYLLLRHL